MTKTEKAIHWMEQIAKDDSHGYDQIFRWGEYGDYDCSSAVITAWEQAGVPVKTSGATYTKNMYSVFILKGFKDITKTVNLNTGKGLKRGDVLLNANRHTAMYCGSGLEVEASINEKGKATGSKAGDQTGKEFLIRSYRNYPWNYVLRYAETTEKSQPVKSAYPSKETKYIGVVHVNTFLSVRTQPTKYSKTCTFSPLYNGYKIDVCDTMKNGWLYIRYNGKYGYVYGKYVQKEG